MFNCGEIAGVSDKIVEFYVDRVILTLLESFNAGMTAQEAYVECVKRYPDSMRAG